MYLGLGKLVLASTVPSNRHPLNVRSDTGPDLGGGSQLGAAPIFLPAAAQGERSAPPPPGPPRAIPRGSRCTPFRQPGATHGAPTAVESAHNARPSQGDGCGPSPCDPLGRRLRRCGAWRGRCAHRRRPARGAAARQGGNPTAHAPSPRGPHPVKGPHGTPHKPPRGARGLVEVAVQTPDGSRPPAAAFARAKAMRGGQSGAHARGGADAVR